MSIVSYAQNFEDVILWRVFHNLDVGFYIDIGAQDPVVDSVSLAFYEHGWRGVHIEPTKQYSDKLRNARPSDFIEQLAVGSSGGPLTFFEFSGTGLSTADPVLAKRHQDAGFFVVETQVEIVPLDFILNKYGDGPVHWLKIDVEGLEKSVLESWCTSQVRPWVLIVESTSPLSQKQTHTEWESMVVEKGYYFAYFDGLNRFYVHQEHYDLLHYFTTPPNIFDGFVLSGTASQPFCQHLTNKLQKAEAKIQEVEAKVEEAEAKVQEVEAKVEDAEVRAKEAEANVSDMCNSRSWRITAPLRWLAFQFRILRERGVKVRAKDFVRKISGPFLRSMIAFIKARPALQQKLVSVADSLGMYKRLRALYHLIQQASSFHDVGTSSSRRNHVPQALQQLTPRARRIYKELVTAIETKKKDQG